MQENDENVGIWAKTASRNPGKDWIIMCARQTLDEQKNSPDWAGPGSPDKVSDSVASLRKLTIQSVKAIQTSTGQDAATKVLFAGIDIALDIGMGIASGGAFAGVKGAVTGSRAISRAALAGAARSATKKGIARSQIKGAAQHTAFEGVRELSNNEAANFARLGAAALEQISSESIFNRIYGNSPDDLILAVNGRQIWPEGGQASSARISSQQK